MEIATISEDELKIILNLSMRFMSMGKSTLFMVPEYNMADNAHQRALLLEKAGHANNLEKMELLINVSDSTDFAELCTQLKTKMKRNVKLYLVSPFGLALYKSHDDKWSDEQKEEYTNCLIQLAPLAPPGV